MFRSKTDFSKHTLTFARIIFFLAIAVCFFSRPWLLQFLMFSCAGLAILGLLGLFKLKAKTFSQTPDLFNIKIIIPIALLQLLMFGLTLIFFYTLERQTQLNPRFHVLATGSILNVLKANPISLGFLPHVFYVVLGIGLASFYSYRKQTPSFARALIPKARTRMQLVVHNYLDLVPKIIIVFTVVWMSCLTIVWLTEGALALLGLSSLFQYPFRSLTIVTLLLLMYRNAVKRYVAWTTPFNWSLGRSLVLYIAMVSFYIICFQALADFCCAGLGAAVEITDPSRVMKSFIMGSFSELELDRRLSFLILGWWLAWAPWMSSFIARMSLISNQRPLGVAVLALCCPAVSFYTMLQIKQEQWQWFYSLGSKPSVQILIILLLMLTIVSIWGRVYNLLDLIRGAMPAMGQSRPAVLKNWLHMVLFAINWYFFGFFMTGWFPVQVSLAIAAFFMLTIGGCFILRQFLEKYHPQDEEKHKVVVSS